MEHALFLNRPAPLAGDFSRLYLGAEFCPWMFPPLAALREGRAAARAAGWAFTLATPVVTEPFLPHLRAVLERLLPELEAADEVLVSDLGALTLVRELDPARSVVLGRVLSGQKRGPQIVNLDLAPEQLAYFRQGAWSSRDGAALLGEWGVRRVELDNLLQGLAPLPPGLQGSLHLPYAMVTSSGTCPFRPHGARGPCAAPCGETFVLRTPQNPIPLLQCGNTQFLENPHPPVELAALGIDRVVHHPRLPR